MTLILTLIKVKVTIVPDSHNFLDIPLIVDEHFHQLLSRSQLFRLPTDFFHAVAQLFNYFNSLFPNYLKVNDLPHPL